MQKQVAMAALVTAMAMVGGCSVNPHPAFQQVDAAVYARLGQHVQWNTGSAEDRQASEAMKRLLAQDLTAEGAVQVALLNNRELQGHFEQIGIAQADLVQAGLLRNPEFAASWRLPDRAPWQTDAEYAVSQDFLDLLILPLRKKVAAGELARTQASVADAVLKLAAEVEEAFYEAQGQQQLVEQLRVIDETNRAAVELANRQHAAGTINDLDLANQQAIATQSGVEVAQANLELTRAREKVNRLLGLGDAGAWKAAPRLPELPEKDPPLEHLEDVAMAKRLDLAASREMVASLGRSLGITEDFRYFSAVKIGVDTEHNPDGSHVTGPTLDLELPIFDQGQARVARGAAAYRQARNRLVQQTVEVRAEVREAYARLAAQRSVATTYAGTLLPQRREILKQTLAHYNMMLKGTYDLLLARQNEVAAERAAIAACRDYWIARSELERAVGGRLGAGGAWMDQDQVNK